MMANTGSRNQIGVYSQRTNNSQRRKEILELYDYVCKACGHKKVGDALQVDHIVPLSKGGTDTLKNLQVLCIPCHSKKTSSEFGRPATNSCFKCGKLPRGDYNTCWNCAEKDKCSCGSLKRKDYMACYKCASRKDSPIADFAPAVKGKSKAVEYLRKMKGTT